MKNTIDKLQAEHADFAKLLNLLEAQLRVFHSGEQPDYGLMLDIFYYLTNFPDRDHHQREELIFAKLAIRDPNTRAAVDELTRQHRTIAQNGARFLENLNAVLGGAILTRESVETPGLEYIAFYRNHLKMEERELFPIARKLLDEKDWAAIDAAIESTADPLFGPRVDERFAGIHDQISRAAA